MKASKESVVASKGATKSRTRAGGSAAAAKSRAKPGGVASSRAESGHSGMSVGSRKTTSTTKGASHK